MSRGKFKTEKLGTYLVTINRELIDKLAEMEVEALLEGIEDPELRKSPAFLDKVRRFLQQNNLKTTQETPGVSRLRRDVEEIPDFDLENESLN